MAIFTFASLGFLTALYLAVQITSFIHLHFLRKGSLQLYLQPRTAAAPWGLITGASDGIGLAFVHTLASAGFNIVLHGRNAKKLANLCNRLKEEHPTRSFRHVVADASLGEPDLQTQLNSLIQQVSPLNLKFLINNVGGSACVSADGTAFKPLQAQSFAEVDRLINLNLRFATQLTRMLLPQLTRPTQQPTLILNVGSLADRGSPFTAVYGGAKAFNKTWSTALAAEMQAGGHDVEVLALEVGVTTETSYARDPAGFLAPGAGAVARAAVGMVGCGRACVAPHWLHAVQAAVVDVLPERVGTWAKTGEAGRQFEAQGKGR